MKSKRRKFLGAAFLMVVVSFVLIVIDGEKFNTIAGICFFLSVILTLIWLVMLIKSFFCNKKVDKNTGMPTISIGTNVPVINEQQDQFNQPSEYSLQDVREFSNVHIHKDLEGLIWFANGPLKNYDETLQTGCGEPSAIDTTLDIEMPTAKTQIDALGYYPQYRFLTPEQRGQYLQYLSNPYMPADIGYAFILYYGLERHLLQGDMEHAFQIILKMRKAIKNNSFLHYSASALVCSAFAKNRHDLLRLFVDSCVLPHEKDIPFDVFVASRVALSIGMTAEEMMQYATQFAFTNNHYIKSDYAAFQAALQDILNERFENGEFPLNSKLIIDLPESPVNSFANTSLPRNIFKLPDVSKCHTLIEEGNALLQAAHERVKAQKRMAR